MRRMASMTAVLLFFCVEEIFHTPARVHLLPAAQELIPQGKALLSLGPEAEISLYIKALR